MAADPRAIAPIELPQVITNYLQAHQARDLDVAVGAYAPDATVVDEGKTYTGPAEIRGWLSRSASEYTYTIELTGATFVDEDRYDVRHHLEGDFPGGRVDVQFRFTLSDGRIAKLAIEG